MGSKQVESMENIKSIFFSLLTGGYLKKQVSFIELPAEINQLKPNGGLLNFSIIHTYIHTYIHIYIYCVCVCVCVCVRVCVCVCVCAIEYAIQW